MTARLSDVAAHLDTLLRVPEVIDYPTALNGIQVAHRGPVHRIAAAVDASVRTIDAAIAAEANLLIVHHGLFWAGAQRIDGRAYARLQRLFTHDIAVYSAHLPLDAHEIHGNSVLLANALGLVATAGFAPFNGVACGVRGASDVSTEELFERLRAFAREHGGEARTTSINADQRTQSWAICTGAGANQDTLREAEERRVDTLIVGEGPHWTAVDAMDSGLTIMYGGHYATETLGVRSIAEHVGQTFDLPWSFLPAPTGL
jgi:dinuclear metal center YbgI/SA1388 family protein